MTSRSRNLIMAIFLAAIFVALFVAGYLFIDQPLIKRICQIFGGYMPQGIIQYITFVFFFWGILEINARVSQVKYEEQSFGLDLLPTKTDWVLSPEDVSNLKHKVTQVHTENKFLMTDIIRKAATKFRSNNSISDVIEIVSRQCAINQGKAEGRQSVIRYLAWALPSVGFIGTILGIASALGLADKASDPEVLGNITSSMYVAFDTTLVALILSIILMWYYYQLQEKEEELHSEMEEYIIENFVNRIHIE